MLLPAVILDHFFLIPNFPPSYCLVAHHVVPQDDGLGAFSLLEGLCLAGTGASAKEWKSVVRTCSLSPNAPLASHHARTCPPANESRQLDWRGGHFNAIVDLPAAQCRRMQGESLPATERWAASHETERTPKRMATRRLRERHGPIQPRNYRRKEVICGVSGDGVRVCDRRACVAGWLNWRRMRDGWRGSALPSPCCFVVVLYRRGVVLRHVLHGIRRCSGPYGGCFCLGKQQLYPARLHVMWASKDCCNRRSFSGKFSILIRSHIELQARDTAIQAVKQQRQEKKNSLEKACTARSGFRTRAWRIAGELIFGGSWRMT